MKTLSFYVDKGHDDIVGHDPGAVNKGLREGTMTAITAQAFTNRIKAHGHYAEIEPGNLDINQSAALANKFGVDYCISFHYNAGGGDRGEVICSWDNKSRELAAIISLGLKRAGQTKVNCYDSPPGKKDTKHEFFGMLRIPIMPAVIIEPCFIDNVADRTLADTQQEQMAIGTCIADAIADAYGSTLDDNLDRCLSKLQRDDVIDYPEYWRDKIAYNKPIHGEYMAKFLKNLTHESDVPSAVDQLVTAEVISSPAYWIANCVVGKTCNPQYVKTLIISSVDH